MTDALVESDAFIVSDVLVLSGENVGANIGNYFFSGTEHRWGPVILKMYRGTPGTGDVHWPNLDR